MQASTQNRQRIILNILQAQPVYSQEELARHLEDAGIVTTQATLSRDLKALKVSKVPGEGYVIINSSRTRAREASNLSSGILRIQFSGQLGVIKTLPGLANAVAISIDHQVGQPVIGTIAGDDTILLILTVDATPEQVLDALEPLFPDIKTHLVI